MSQFSDSAKMTVSSSHESSDSVSGKRLRVPRESLISLSVCVFYGVTSLTLSLINKALLSAYSFNCYFLLLGCQMATQLFICALSRDHFNNVFQVPKYDRSIHVSSLKMGAMYVLNVVAGLIGLQMVNVPMFFCIRRLVSPTILFYEYFALGKVADFDIRVAIGFIMVGTIVAGWETLDSHIVGYIITMFNNICTAATTVMQKQFSERHRMTAVGTLYYNAMTAAPLAFVLAIVNGEIAELNNFEHIGELKFWFSFVVACLLGPILTYSSMLCTTYNSPLATSVTGNIKDIATTIFGAILFPGFQPTVTNILGLSLSFGGAGAYSVINLNKAMKKDKDSSFLPVSSTNIEDKDEDIAPENTGTDFATSPRYFDSVSIADSEESKEPTQRNVQNQRKPSGRSIPSRNDTGYATGASFGGGYSMADHLEFTQEESAILGIQTPGSSTYSSSKLYTI